MQQIQPKKISGIWDEVRTYLNTRLEYFRLKAIEKMAKIMADLLSSILFLFLISAALLAAVITVAFYLSVLLDSYLLGFGCATAFLAVGSLLVLWAKDKLAHLITGVTVKRYFERHCDLHQDMEEEPCDDWQHHQ